MTSALFHLLRVIMCAQGDVYTVWMETPLRDEQVRWVENHAMNHFVGILAVCALAGLVGGCNTLARQPKLAEPKITPDQLKPGDTAIITVHVADRHHIIRKIEGFVEQDPRVKFKLRDDGVVPDEKANDHVWTMQVDVPFQAPPGDYVLEFTAYRSDGTPVPVRQKGKTVPLKVSIPVSIRTP